jgi:GNAT superfamily N-acetyltransferase
MKNINEETGINTFEKNQEFDDKPTDEIISKSSQNTGIIEFPAKENLSQWRNIIVPMSPFVGTPKTKIVGNGCFTHFPVTESFRRFSGGGESDPVVMNPDSNQIFEGYSMSYCDMDEAFENGDSCSFMFTWTDKMWKYTEQRIGEVKVISFLDGVLLDVIRIQPDKQGQGHGTRLLNIVLNKSIETQIKVYVHPGELRRSQHSLNVKQLHEWYVRHGFLKVLPLCLPVTRLSYFKGGDTFIKKSGFYVFCPWES